MSNQLKVKKLYSMVLVEVGLALRQEAVATQRLADRARAVSFDVLAGDLRQLAARLEKHAATLGRFCRRPREEVLE